jgi:CheY-like chemotaxis protein
VSNYRFSVLTILIVDDSKSMRSLIRVILQSWGVGTIYEAEDTDAAWQRLNEYNIDVVLVDIMMQPMTGIEFTKKIRNDDTSADPFVPVIIISGYTEREKVEAARDSGANQIMTKPITANSLYARVVDVIEHPRPFLRSADYFGPDRRRAQDPNYEGVERRVAPASAGLIAGGKPQ